MFLISMARIRSLLSGCSPWLALLLSAAPSFAGDWPHWRGPSRNDIVVEASGWAAEGWLSEKPTWRMKVDRGASSPLVVGGKLYVMGWNDERDTINSHDAESREAVWRKT